MSPRVAGNVYDRLLLAAQGSSLMDISIMCVIVVRPITTPPTTADFFLATQVIGSVNQILTKLYPTQYKGSAAARNVGSFAGTVVGQLLFGYLSDHWSRKWSLMASTIILIIFAALAACSYGGGTISGVLAALTAWRFFIGIGIGRSPLRRLQSLHGVQ